MKFDDGIPIFLQIASLIESQILSGELENGQKLSSIRELSMLYKVNPNTVQKSLSILESKGFLVTKRTQGKFVVSDPQLVENEKSKIARQKALVYLEELKKLGMDKEEAIRFLKETDDGNQN